MSKLSLAHYVAKAETVLASDTSEYVTESVIVHKYDDGYMKAVTMLSRGSR